MSFINRNITATCKTAGILSVDDFVETLLVEFFQSFQFKDKPQMPECLQTLSPAEARETMLKYLLPETGELTIKFDTEGENDNRLIFDYLLEGARRHQTSPFMVVTHITFDSRTGYAAHVEYINRSGKAIDILELIKDLHRHFPTAF